MKLFGLMLVKNDDWVLGLSARVALKWCDAVVFLNTGTNDNSYQILTKIKEENSDRVFLISDTLDSKAFDPDLREVLLNKAVIEGATHIAILDPSEILTANILGIKEDILKLREGEMLILPAFYCWKGLTQYRSDASIWGNGKVPVAFRYSHSVSWKGASNTERIPRGMQWSLVNPISTNLGGVLNLEQVHWRRARAKYFLDDMKEAIKRSPWKSEAPVQKPHPLDENGIKLSKVPSEWYAGNEELLRLISMKSKSAYESGISGMMAEYGYEVFSGIPVPTERIQVAIEAPPLPPLPPPSPPSRVMLHVDLPPPKYKAKQAPPGTRKYVSEKTEQMYVKKVSFPKHTIRWSGHFLDYSGYGKANREIMFRVANTLNVLLDVSEIGKEPILVDERTRARVFSQASVGLPDDSPYLRFFGPRREEYKGRKTCFTMMETYGAHPDLVDLLNRYDDVWVPTEWNKSIFLGSGVTSPIHTVPLGVNPLIYKPGERKALPLSTLITTSRKGEREVPKGFIFINTSNPSFRKGVDMAVRCFEDAFQGDPDVCLVLCVSYSSIVHCDPFSLIPGGAEACKSKVYVLDGKMDEHQMAGMYRSCDAYITASRGEGWNLPLMEASACGLPVIAPDAFSHKEFLTEEDSFLFSPDGMMAIPDSEKISPWYKDQLFVHYGEDSIRKLSELMRAAFESKDLSRLKAEKLRKKILEKYTWDIVADKVSKLLLEVIA